MSAKKIVRRIPVLICLALFAGCTSSMQEIADQADEISNNTLVSNRLQDASRAETFSIDQPAMECQDARVGELNNAVATSPSLPKSERESDDKFSQRRNFVSSMRVWRDRDLKYSTNAELLEVSLQDRTIKLLKENGFAITVPIERLSEHDKNFLIHFVSSQSDSADSHDQPHQD